MMNAKTLPTGSHTSGTVGRRGWLLGGAAVLCVLACLGRVCGYDFVHYDDSVHVYANPRLKRPGVGAAWRFWKAPYKGLYVPVTYSAWTAVAAATSERSDGKTSHRPGPFHALNLVVHCAAVLVVFAILRTLLQSDWAAFAGALLFGLHPLQVEPVAWVSGLKTVLGGLLALGAVRAYLGFAAQPDGNRWLSYAIGLALFGLAMLSWPGALVAPVIAGVLACTMLGRPVRRAAAELGPWFALTVPIVIVTKLAQPNAEIGAVPPVWQRPLVAGDALTFYLSKLALPVGLVTDYGRTPGVVLGQPWVVGTAALPVVLAGLIAWRYRRPWVLAAAGVFVAGLAPVLGLVPFQFQTFSTVADRYVYLSMLGPALAMAWLVRSGRVRVVLPVCSGLILVAAVLTARQVGYWRDTGTLLGHTLAINPDSVASRVNLGAYEEQQGRTGRAIEQYLAALALDPDEYRAHFNLGRIARKARRFETAARCFQRAVAANPDYERAQYELGVVLLKTGRLAEAARHLSISLDLSPQNREHKYWRLAQVRELQGRAAEAAELYQKALGVRPDFLPAQRGIE
ncbi:MAG: tetratricopeptide repeat protein [Planctomycetota bacterium]